MKSFAAIRATGRGSARARISSTIAGALSAAAVAAGIVHAAPRLRRAAGLCGGARRHDGAADRFVAGARIGASRTTTICGSTGSIWREELEPAGAVALAGSEHRSRRRPADQGGSDQHGAFARGAAAAAGSSPGRIHAERGSAAAGRSAAAPRQIAGAAADGAALAAGPSGSAEVRLRSAGASLAAAASAGAARGGRRA